MLTGTNTYSGTTSISAGVVQFNAPYSIGGGTAANVTVTSGAVAAAGYVMDQGFIGRLSVSSSGVAALAVNSGNNLDFSTSGANLPFVSLGAVGSATYSGTLTPGGGNYRLGGGGSTLMFNSFMSDVGGPTGLIVNGSGTPGTVVIAASNAYSGNTTLTGGWLAIGDNASLGSGTLALNGGTLQNINTLSGVANTITVGGTTILAGSNNLTLLGTVTNSGGSRTTTDSTIPPRRRSAAISTCRRLAASAAASRSTAIRPIRRLCSAATSPTHRKASPAGRPAR